VNCVEARERLLEADTAELRGIGDTALSTHVRDCADCAAIARRMLSAAKELQRALDAVQPVTVVDAALGERRVRLRRERGRRWRLAGIVAVAAAATLAGLAIVRNERPDVATDWRPPVAESPGLDVEAPPGTDVAVFEVAGRPDIVIVWLFETGEQSE